jgi:hypothetical protein
MIGVFSIPQVATPRKTPFPAANSTLLYNGFTIHLLVATGHSPTHNRKSNGLAPNNLPIVLVTVTPPRQQSIKHQLSPLVGILPQVQPAVNHAMLFNQD